MTRTGGFGPYDLLVFALLALLAAFSLLIMGGCASAPPPRHPDWHERIDMNAAVYLDGDGYSCSGVAIGDHEVLTAAHCVDRGPLTVVAYPGEPREVVSVEKYPDGRDVALVRVAGKPLPVQVRFAPEGELKAGDIVFAAGFGCYGALAPAPGLYVGTRAQDGQLVLAMGVCPGDSGGPVLDDEGRLIGVLSARGVDKPLAFAEDVR